MKNDIWTELRDLGIAADVLYNTDLEDWSSDGEDRWEYVEDSWGLYNEVA